MKNLNLVTKQLPVLANLMSVLDVELDDLLSTPLVISDTLYQFSFDKEELYFRVDITFEQSTAGRTLVSMSNFTNEATLLEYVDEFVSISTTTAANIESEIHCLPLDGELFITFTDQQLLDSIPPAELAKQIGVITDSVTFTSDLSFTQHLNELRKAKTGKDSICSSTYATVLLIMAHKQLNAQAFDAESDANLEQSDKSCITLIMNDKWHITAPERVIINARTAKELFEFIHPAPNEFEGLETYVSFGRRAIKEKLGFDFPVKQAEEKTLDIIRQYEQYLSSTGEYNYSFTVTNGKSFIRAKAKTIDSALASIEQFRLRGYNQVTDASFDIN